MNTMLFIMGLVIYIGIMILLGTYCSRGKAEGENYLTGGGRLPFFLIFATLAASFIGTGSSVGATANGLRYGWGASVFGAGTAAGLLVLVISLRNQKVRSKGFKTMAEEAQFLYGGRREIKYLFAVLMLLGQIVALGTHITGGATYLAYITGMHFVLAKVLTVAAFGIYLVIGGYLAVVWTDLIQLIILVLGFAIITVMVIVKAGGWSEIAQTLQATGAQGNLSFYGVESMGIMSMLSMFFSVFLTQNGSSVVRLRIYTSRDDSVAGKSLLSAAGVAFIFSFIPAIIGMAAYTIACQTGQTSIFETPDFTFSFVASQVLGPVFGLLFLIAGLSATLSSGDSDTIAAVTIFIEDIVPMLTGKRVREEAMSKVSRYVTMLVLIFALLSTFLASDIMSYVTNVMGAVTPALAVAMLVGNLWKRVTWQGGITATVLGTGMGILYLLNGTVHQWVTERFAGPSLPVAVMTLVVLSGVSLLTPKDTSTEAERMQKVLQLRAGRK